MKQPHHEVQFCAWSYDHWVRDERELERIVEYIEQNPVRAGLVANAEDYRWGARDAQRARILMRNSRTVGLGATALSDLESMP